MSLKLMPASESCWLQTLTGVMFYPLAPTPEMINITDIAGSLSKQCRYMGHCRWFYSIAEHCVHVAEQVSYANKLTALLHDASEAYLTDVPRPVKPFLTNYYDLEDRLMRVIAERYGIQWPLPPEVKEADTAILSDERTQNMNPALVDEANDPKMWGNPLPALGIELKFWTPDQAMNEFMLAFQRYGGK